MMHQAAERILTAAVGINNTIVTKNVMHSQTFKKLNEKQ